MIPFLASSTVFALLLVWISVVQVRSKKRSKQTEQQAQQEILNVAEVAERRHERRFERRSTLIDQQFPELASKRNGSAAG